MNAISRPAAVPRALASSTHAHAADDRLKADMIDGLRKGLEVICAFDDATPRLSQSELATRLSLSRAAARRYLLTLTALGYMATDGKWYWLTPKVMQLGHSYVASSRLPRTVLPALQKLTETLGEATNLAVLQGGDAVYISRASAAKLLSTHIEPGTRLPAHATAAGRVLLSHLSETALEDWLSAHPRVAYTAHTMTDAAALRQLLAKVRHQGFSVTEGQFESGLRGIAVPLFDNNEHLVGAIGVSMAISAMPASAAVKRCLPALQAAATQLRGQL